MIIESKFDIDDTVYYMHKNEIKSDIICGINITVDSTSNGGMYQRIPKKTVISYSFLDYDTLYGSQSMSTVLILLSPETLYKYSDF